VLGFYECSVNTHKNIVHYLSEKEKIGFIFSFVSPGPLIRSPRL